MDKVNVLAVDDHKVNLLAIQAALGLDEVELHMASSGEEALATMLDVDFAVVLLDVQMPGMDGFEIAAQMRRDKRTEDTPIIFVTATSKDEKHVFKGYEKGAVDYLFKPVESEILRSKVRVFAKLYLQKISLEKNIAALKRANRHLLQRHDEKIEEEHIKVLFQLAGATAIEFNQPLMALKRNLGILRSEKDGALKPDTRISCIDKIEASAKRIAEIVQKLQTIQQNRILRHDTVTPVADSHQTIHVLYLEEDKLIFDLVHAFGQKSNIQFERAASIKEGRDKLSASEYHLVFVSYHLPDGTGLGFMTGMKDVGVNIPVVVITGIDDEILVSNMIQQGVCEYLPISDLNQERLVEACYKALERATLNRELEMIQQRLAELALD